VLLTNYKYLQRLTDNFVHFVQKSNENPEMLRKIMMRKHGLGAGDDAYTEVNTLLD